jgi:hypothetical protein
MRPRSYITGVVVATPSVPADTALTRVGFLIPDFELEAFELDIFAAVLGML